MGGGVLILLDTQALVWFAERNANLGPSCRASVDRALAERETVAAATISFWEVAMLIAKGRIELDLDKRAWRLGLLARGLVEVPLDATTALLAGELDSLHGDPADRIVVATALLNDAQLVTSDRKILAWDGPLQRLDARS